MTTDALTTPNGACRAACDIALRLFALNRDWQHEWHALTGRRIERDRDAARQLQQALAETREWTEFGAAAQRVMRDYAIASAAIWQDAVEWGMRTQYEEAGVWRTWLREYGADMLSRYQTDWLPDVSRLVVVNEASMPWHEWMAAFGRGMTNMAGANATQEHDHVR